MNPQFESIADSPWNQVFGVVFFPDRIYHAQYLNATRSPRYRYDVHEVRGKADINVLKGTVYMDGLPLSPFIRIEYRASRLVEVAREKGRFVNQELLAEIALREPGREETPDAYRQATLKLRYCPWIDAYQVEIWRNLSALPGRRHDLAVLDMIGAGGAITKVPAFDDMLVDPKRIRRLKLRFRENDVDLPFGYRINNPVFDNYYNRNIQVPNREQPNSLNHGTTQQTDAYTIDFQRGWFVKDVSEVVPTVYENPLIEPISPDFKPGNHVEMRWIFQREFGGNVTFFHEVTVPPNQVEGTHQHIGSEELYYITEGEGLAYMGVNDDLEMKGQYPEVERHIYGIGPRKCYEVPVKAGSVIFTKSGGIHGIQNPKNKPLKFVAFLYHSS